MALRTAERVEVRTRRIPEISLPTDPINQDPDMRPLRAKMVAGAVALGMVGYLATTYVEPQVSAGFTAFTALIGAWAGAPSSRS